MTLLASPNLDVHLAETDERRGPYVRRLTRTANPRLAKVRAFGEWAGYRSTWPCHCLTWLECTLTPEPRWQIW